MKETQEPSTRSRLIMIHVTQKIIDKGRKSIFNSYKCIGARTLRKALRKGFLKDLKATKFDISWGMTKGCLFFAKDALDLSSFHVDGKTPIDLMSIVSPISVILKLDDNN